jgi:hypothetical protein
MKTKHILLKTILVICLIIIGLVLHFYLWWNEKPVISIDYVAKFNEMRKPADYRPEDDGDPLFVEACRMMTKANEDDHMPDVHWTRSYRLAYGPGQWRSISITWPTDMNSVEQQDIRAWLARRNEIFTKLDEAMTKECFWLKWPGPKADIETFDTRDCDLFEMGRILLLHGRMKIAEGDIEGGLRDVLAAMDSGKCFGEKPSDQEWGWGMRRTSEVCLTVLVGASLTEFPCNQLARVADEINRATRRYDSMDSVMAYERLCFLDRVQRCFSDNSYGNGRILPGVIRPATDCLCDKTELQRFCETMWYCFNTESRRNTIARYDSIMASSRSLMDIEPWQVRQRQPDPWVSLDKQVAKNWFLTWTGTGKSLANQSHWHKATVAGTVSVLQVLRYKTEAGGLPDGWEDIVKKGWLAELPRDIYSGNPFIYRKTPDGFTAYSVGENGIDDGGDRKKDIIFWPVERVDPQPAPAPQPSE